MKTVDDFRKEILFKRGLKSNPVMTFEELFGGRSSADSVLNTAIEKAIENILGDLLEGVVDRLLSDQRVVDSIVGGVIDNIPIPDQPKDGYTPKKGVDYFTSREIDSIITTAVERIPVPVDGYTPKKGVDYFDGTDGSPDSGEQIVTKINELPITPAKQIDAKHIKNLPKELSSKSTALFRGGLKLVWDTELQGAVDGVNTVFTIPGSLPEPKDGKIIISARGALKFAEEGDCTVSGRTITFTYPPPNGSAQPRVVLYHGK